MSRKMTQATSQSKSEATPKLGCHIFFQKWYFHGIFSGYFSVFSWLSTSFFMVFFSFPMSNVSNKGGNSK